jgi:hypothetical protein
MWPMQLGRKRLGTIGYAGDWAGRGSAKGKLKSVEELFEDRHFDRSCACHGLGRNPPGTFCEQSCPLVFLPLAPAAL